MSLRRLGILVFAAALAGPAATAATAASAQAATAGHTAPWPHATLSVGGTVADPATYTMSQLEALPSETVTVPWSGGGRGHRTVTATGVSLDGLVNTASPVLPPDKNALLRVIVTAQGPFGRQVSFALGELDPMFGDHDAVIVLSVSGHRLRAPALAVPGDSGPLRELAVVNRIDIGVTNPVVVTPPTAGAVLVETGHGTVTLSAHELARLPAQTVTVSFLTMTGPETLTETGPALSEVLWAARVRAGLTTWVAAVGSDSYVATVTPAEAWVGGRTLLLSLDEDGAPLASPRLVTDGDIYGGRYVDGVDDLVVGQGTP
jgi:hypothetical protein